MTKHHYILMSYIIEYFYTSDLHVTKHTVHNCSPSSLCPNSEPLLNENTQKTTLLALEAAFERHNTED